MLLRARALTLRTSPYTCFRYLPRTQLCIKSLSVRSYTYPAGDATPVAASPDTETKSLSTRISKDGNEPKTGSSSRTSKSEKQDEADERDGQSQNLNKKGASPIEPKRRQSKGSASAKSAALKIAKRKAAIRALKKQARKAVEGDSKPDKNIPLKPLNVADVLASHQGLAQSLKNALTSHPTSKVFNKRGRVRLVSSVPSPKTKFDVTNLISDSKIRATEHRNTETSSSPRDGSKDNKQDDARESARIRHFRAAEEKKSTAAKAPARKTLKPKNPVSKNAKVEESENTDDHTDVKVMEAGQSSLTSIDVPQAAVPTLQYGLDRVLFNPGVYHLQDPRTRVYNFDPYLEKIMPMSEFDFTALKEFIPPSKDIVLAAIANENNKKYIGSTSSMTGALAHFHYLLSAWRLVDTQMLSRGFPESAESFTKIQRGPAAIIFRWQPRTRTYAIDADKLYDTPTVLTMLGKALEKLLTVPNHEYEAYRKSKSGHSSKTRDLEPEVYHFSTFGDFVMRSQLDAHDPRLPGTGVFDLKTRAVLSVRMNVDRKETGYGYEIRSPQGQYESFEREYYDMLRATALKYSLQVRLGRMDGIFVAFHNVVRMFGFQYISLGEMDRAIHGQSDRTLGDQELELSLMLWNEILDKATARFPDQTLRIHLETREAKVPFMYIFAEPVSDEIIDRLIEKRKAADDEFERNIMGLNLSEPTADRGIQEGWAEIKAMVEEEMTADIKGNETAELDSDLYSRLSEFADQISKKRQQLTVHPAESLDAEAEDAEMSELAREADEVEQELSMLRSIANQFIAKTQGFKDKLRQHEEGNPGLRAVVDQLEDIIEDVQEESGRFSILLGETEEAAKSIEAELTDTEDNQGTNDEECSVVQDAKGSEVLVANAKDPQGHDRESHENIEQASGQNVIESEKEDTKNDNHGRGAFDNTLEKSHDDTDEAWEDLSDSDEAAISSEREGAVDNHGVFEELEKATTMQADGSTPSDSPPSAKQIRSDLAAQDHKKIFQAAERLFENDPLSNPDNVMAMTLTIRNKVNNLYVDRPSQLHSSHAWTLEYSLNEIEDKSKASQLYQGCKTRRKKLAFSESRNDGEAPLDYFRQILKNISDQGRMWRTERDELDREGSKILFTPLSDSSGSQTEAQSAEFRNREMEAVNDYLQWLYKK